MAEAQKAYQLIYYMTTNKKSVIYAKLNFNDILVLYENKGLGFGVERVDFNRGSRKVVQQTMGQISGDSVKDNIYVDTWWVSPPKIVLAGVVQMPAGLDDSFAVGYINPTGATNPTNNKSVLGTIQEIFRKNNHPVSVTNGDYVEFHDYTRKEYYRVSLKNFNTGASVERPNLMTFNLEMDILEEMIDSTTDSGATTQPAYELTLPIFGRII